MKKLASYTPFILIICVNATSAFMQKSGRQIDDITVFLVLIAVLTVLNLILGLTKKMLSYFSIAIIVVTLSGILSVFLLPGIGILFLENTIAALYIALFSAAFFPPLLKFDPFTYEFSKKDYSEAVQKMPQFKSINLILNYIWALLFAASFILTLVIYTDNYTLQQILQNSLPMAIMLLIGLPLTVKLPGILMSRGSSEKHHFESVREMLEVMPYGLNTKKSNGIDVIMQFKLSGKEKINGYLTIRNNECSYRDGIHPEPTTTIIADSSLWLNVSNGDVSGDEAFLKKEYTVEGDSGFLLKLTDLFAPSKPVIRRRQERNSGSEKTFSYKILKANQIKKILVINASPRTNKYSKSLIMAGKFMEGAESAGAEIEMITLKEKTINYCTGCFTCWTKTPGICIHKDDMPPLINKVRTADLLVFITPLYYFSVSAQLKAFIDRLLPNMKPYMVETNGIIHHPSRFEDDSPSGLVVFAAGGFPEIKNNFDGISAIVRNMGSHLPSIRLMAEFFLPASELLQVPVYRERRKRVEQACFNAGQDAVIKGKISIKYMKTVADPEIDKKTFMDQANMFWKTLDGKTSYYKATSRLSGKE
ncbi:MAG: NAD(P)H-dependent oxidoreductase [Spirochaetaceae bacterium]|nr:NAD(P)H-dependent oxidoreductase [Spirochaetaceae bacterium]